MSQDYNKITSYKDLIAWQKAIELAVVIYQLTAGLPDSEKFGLTNQIRRASVSVSSNIAEGFGRRSHAERLRFYEISRGSLNEVESQLIIATKIRYISDEDFSRIQQLISDGLGLLGGLISKTRQIHLAS